MGGAKGRKGGKKPGGRAVAFSGKQKKAQLRAKRERKKEQRRHAEDETRTTTHSETSDSVEDRQDSMASTATSSSPQFSVHRAMGTQAVVGSVDLGTYIQREPEEAVTKRKEHGMKPLRKNHEGETDGVLAPVIEWIEHPSRDQQLVESVAATTTGTAAEALNAAERARFEEYLRSVHQLEIRTDHDLGPFEHNLEVWRQLWRVIERSDVLALVADVRAASLHLPASLCSEGCIDKPVVVILTKIDLVPDNVIVAWESWIKTEYPTVTVLRFQPPSSVPLQGEDRPSQRRRILKRHRPKDDDKELEFAHSILRQFNEV